MIYLPDTNACISLLRQKQPHLIARWRSTKVADITLCSIVVYELRHGAESSSDPQREHAKLDVWKTGSLDQRASTSPGCLKTI